LVFGMACPVILRTTDFCTALCTGTPADWNRHTVNDIDARSAEHIGQ
jgi:hypothetical protein